MVAQEVVGQVSRYSVADVPPGDTYWAALLCTLAGPGVGVSPRELAVADSSVLGATWSRACADDVGAYEISVEEAAAACYRLCLYGFVVPVQPAESATAKQKQSKESSNQLYCPAMYIDYERSVGHMVGLVRNRGNWRGSDGRQGQDGQHRR